MFKSQELVDEMEGLRKFALRLTGNKADAEDLVQATALRALEKKHLFKENTDLFKWTSKIMFNMFASQYRRKTKFESQYDPEPVIERQSRPANQYKKMQCSEIYDAMQDMSRNHRYVLDAICIKGRKYKTVAKKLGVPVGTVRSRLSRAREQLQDNLNQKNIRAQAA